MRGALLISILMGCSEPEPVEYAPIMRGDAAACIGNNLDVSFDFFENINYRVAGMVEEQAPGIEFNLAPCDIANSDSIRVRSGDGVRWIFGWRITDRAGKDVAPEAALAPGTEVDVTFRGALDGKSQSGLVIRDEHGLAAVVNINDQVKALDDLDLMALDDGKKESTDDVPMLTVDYGSWNTTNDLECGTAHGYDVEFVGDETKVLRPFSQDVLAVGGREMDIFAVSGMEYPDGSDCVGVGNQLVWAAFRRQVILPPTTSTLTEDTAATSGTDTGTTTTTTTTTYPDPSGDTGTYY